MNFTTKEQAKEYLKGQLESYLQGKGIDTRKNFKCLVCDGGHRTPNMGYKNNRIHCFACGADMDIISLIGHETGRSGADLFNHCHNLFGITVGGNEGTRKQRNQAQHSKATEHDASAAPQQIDYTDYFLQAKEALHKSPEALGYIHGRGIGTATAERFMLGYDLVWRSPKAVREGKNPPSSPRLIIPTSKYSYLARATDKDTAPAFKSMKEGAAELFNKKALYGSLPVFVTEGEIDALSIIEAGGEALALGSANNINKLIALCKNEKPTASLILSLDNDDIGREAQRKLKSELEALEILFLEVNIAGSHKDPNDALKADRNLFCRAIDSATAQMTEYMRDADSIREAQKAAEKEKYINATSVTACISNFLGDIKKSVDTPAIPTNFAGLDELLDDGLYEGLYILGAISSLGKTSFVLQIADQIAQQRRDVLIFSLEMAKTELMAKSISRITFSECGGNISNAKTVRGIMSGKRHSRYSNEEKALINKSINLYATYTDYLYIYEGMGDIGVETVKETAEQHIKATGNKPVIVIDYLQILAPVDMRATDKQNTDRAVFELKRLSRDLKIPVVGISSLNRENYNAAISMAAFKESGAIEYSSDVLLGLQFEAMGDTLGADNAKVTSENINRFKQQDPRKIELKILKNRNGATGNSITYDYYPKFNLFKETGIKRNDDGKETIEAVRARRNNKR